MKLYVYEMETVLVLDMKSLSFMHVMLLLGSCVSVYAEHFSDRADSLWIGYELKLELVNSVHQKLCTWFCWMCVNIFFLQKY